MSLKVHRPDHYQVVLSQLPAEHVVQGKPIQGIILSVFGLFFALPTVAVFLSIFNGTFQPQMLLVLIFTLVGLTIFWQGVKLASLKRMIRFDTDRVSVEEKTLFRHSSWSETWNRFEGIRYWSKHLSSRRSGVSHTVHIIELYHLDRDKRVLLYHSRMGANLRQLQEDYCKVLNLPAISDFGVDISIRAVEDLDKSVLDFASEGKLDISFDANKPAPKGVKLAYEDGQFRIDLPKIRMPIFGGLIWLILSTAFIFVGFLMPGGGPVVFGVFGMLFLLIFLGMIFWYAISHIVLRVGSNSVTSVFHTPWGEVGEITVDLNRVESIQIGQRVKNQGQPGLLFVTDDGIKMIGQGLPKMILEWSKACIIAIVKGQLDSDTANNLERKKYM